MRNQQVYITCVQATVVIGVVVVILNVLGYTSYFSQKINYPCPHRKEKNMEAPSMVGVSQEDPALAAYIRGRMVAPSVLPYNLTRPQVEHFAQLGPKQYLNTDLLNQTDGFFVEVGAVNGELYSNTLFLERRLGWRGVLIEAFPGTYNELLHKHRKAYCLQAALSPTNVSSVVNFQTLGHKGVVGHITGDKSQGLKVEAYPLYAILQALNVSVIHYLSLDVEGHELMVLKTVPWNKMQVRLMNVEWNHVPGGFKVVKDFMVSKGYRFLGNNGQDALFGWPALLDKPSKKL